MRHSNRTLHDMMRFLVAAVCLLAVACLDLACAQKPAVTGDSLLTGTPCAPPCWEGIVPGEADEALVVRVLEESPFVRKGSVDARPVDERGVFLREVEWYGRGYAPSWVYLRDNRVLRNEVRLNRGPTLGQIVEKYGPPEGIHAYIAHPPVYVIVLDYPSRGFTLFSQNEPVRFRGLDTYRIGKDTGKLEQGYHVTFVIYYAPTTLPAALRDVFQYSPKYAERVLAVVRPWEGFGQIPLEKDVQR